MSERARERRRKRSGDEVGEEGRWRPRGGPGGTRARERVTGRPGCGDPKSRIRHAAVYRS